jgi:hypothetical protein
MSAGEPSTPPRELRQRVLAMAGREVAPTRDQIRRWRARVVVSGTIAAVALFVAVGGMHQGARSTEMLVLSAAGWAAAAAAATWAAFGMRRGMLGPPTAVLAAAALLVAPLLAAWAEVFVDASPEAVVVIPARLHVACFAFTLLYSLIPLALMMTLRRGSDPVHPRALGALLGAAAGGWGSVLIDLHCPVTVRLHVLLGHVLPVVVLASIGALLGGALLNLKRR